VIVLELICLAIIATFVAAKLRLDPAPRAFLARLALLVVAAWGAENSVIHAYGFYGYSPEWTVFVDQVPLMVLLIWPIVIHSAWDLARYLLRADASRAHTDGSAVSVGRVAGLASLIVLTDASLIEPIAVANGLWYWTEPGLFAVPPIGIIGWALFALGCFVLFELQRRHAWPISRLLLVLIAPALWTHAALLALWWGALRWVNGTVDPSAAVAVAWIASLALTALVAARGLATRVPLIELVLRIPAALFFFVLLGMQAVGAAPVAWLVPWALAFAPPYLALSTLRARGSRPDGDRSGAGS
jgi:hypothetical protein